MIVRIIWGRLVPGAWPSIEQIYKEFNVESIPGLRARLITQDVNDPESMYAIAFWEDMASLQRWLDSDHYRRGFQVALRPFLAGSQSVSMGEVRIEEISAMLSSGGATAGAS